MTSFFSLEHEPQPKESLTQIRGLLRDGGYLYAIVPNIYSVNRADLLVVDHLHHYSLSSMKHCLSSCGFELIKIDNESHQQASIYIAKDVQGQTGEIELYPEQIRTTLLAAHELANYWKQVQANLDKFESGLTTTGVENLYIYGAGIVGIYLYSRFKKKKMIAGFIDSNQHKQKKCIADCGSLRLIMLNCRRPMHFWWV